MVKVGRTLIVTDTTLASLDAQLLASVQTTYLNPSKYAYDTIGDS